MKTVLILFLIAVALPGCVMLDSTPPNGQYPPPLGRPAPYPPAPSPEPGAAEYLIRLRSPQLSPVAFAAERGLQYVRTLRGDPAQHVFRGTASPGYLRSLRNDASVVSAYLNSPSQNQRGRIVR